jgi:hypothetical protein
MLLWQWLLFEIWRLEILLKINLDNTTEIHENNGDCKVLMNSEVEKMWVEAVVA